MTFFLVNHKIPESAEDIISQYGRVIRIPAFEKLAYPVDAHPDMQAVNINGKHFIHGSNTALAAILEAHGIPCAVTEAPVGAEYPRDVALNLFSVKDTLFANMKYASPEVTEFAEAHGITSVHVKQGYAKCSSMLLGDAVVSADRSIYNAAVLRGIDTLLISAGNIGIEKYDTGFIGGASCLLCDGKVGVFGSLGSHPDHAEIRAFADKRGFEITELCEGALFDYGGAVRIDI